MGYEFFKATHFLAVVVFIIVFFWHCDYTLTSWYAPYTIPLNPEDPS
jgi:formate hydrogenlyase subunit 3/multisubunit Na+/H+ antiporter MnhD subunit